MELKRAGDRFLMEAFVNAKFDAKQLKLLNEVRNWLKAVTLADVVTADGRTFLPGIKRGERSSQQLHNYSWPRQPDRLTKAHWDIWEEALNKCFGGHLEPDRLLHPLGMWKTAAERTMGMDGQHRQCNIVQENPQWVAVTLHHQRRSSPGIHLQKTRTQSEHFATRQQTNGHQHCGIEKRPNQSEHLFHRWM